MSKPIKDHSGDDSSIPGPFESLGRKLDDRPEVQAAEEALRQAREQLEYAHQYYSEVRSQAAESLHHLRGRNVKDIVASTLELVSKHPGPGVLAALACGWFVGRIFRR